MNNVHPIFQQILKPFCPEPDYEALFDLWADFGDEESPEAVGNVIKEHDLGDIDAISFTAYCAGFAKAAEQFKEEE